MKIILVLIYLYGMIHVIMKHKHLFAKRVPFWDWTPHKIEYVEAALWAISWPITWIRRAVEFHLDQPYLKD